MLRRGGQVLLLVPPALERLLGSLEAPHRLLTSWHALPRFDLHCPLLSLPRVFGTTLDTIPARTPYLRAEPETAERWLKRLGRTPGRLHVGLAWAGNPDHLNDRNRSIAFETLAPLWAVPDLAWFSLQVGPRAADLAGLPEDRVADLAPGLTDFAETAGVISALDLVVTVDTAVAHLAGALRRPVWLMLPHVPDWRWLLGREDSPWYPGMRLFRQSRAGDWEGVVGRIASELKAAARA